MKAVIFAGGFGTRLGNRTSLIPKPMVEIGEKPILWHIMKTFSFYGVNDFVICLGYKGSVIRDYFYHYQVKNSDFTVDLKSKETVFHDNCGEEDWMVTLAETGLETLKGGRLKRVEKYIKDDFFFLTYGDGVADIDINELLDFHKSHGRMVSITGVHPPARFGELVEEENIVKSFEEKPQASKGLINGGFMVINKDLLAMLSEAKDCDFENDVLEKLANQGQVMVYKHTGNWECIDNERDVQHLNLLWKKGLAFWKVW